MTITPTIDQERLGVALRNSPPEVRDRLAGMFVANDWPSLRGDPIDDDKLYEIANTLALEAGLGGHTLTIPVKTAGFIGRIQSLPDDLADLSAILARDCEVGPISTVVRPDLWTLEQWRECDRILTEAEDEAAVRLRKIHAADVCTDDERHRRCDVITCGRTQSSRKLTGPEAAHYCACATNLLAEGGFTPYLPDWKVESKRAGRTQADALARVKEWCKWRNANAADRPAKLADLHTGSHPNAHRMIAYALRAVPTSLQLAPTDGPIVAPAAADPLDAWGGAPGTPLNIPAAADPLGPARAVADALENLMDSADGCPNDDDAPAPDLATLLTVPPDDGLGALPLLTVEDITDVAFPTPPPDPLLADLPPQREPNEGDAQREPSADAELVALQDVDVATIDEARATVGLPPLANDETMAKARELADNINASRAAREHADATGVQITGTLDNRGLSNILHAMRTPPPAEPPADLATLQAAIDDLFDAAARYKLARTVVDDYLSAMGLDGFVIA